MKYQLGNHSGRAWAVECVVCTNSETILDGLVPMDGGDYEDDAREIVGAATSILARQLDYDTDSNFANWHGGRYSHQAALYGFEPVGFGAVRWFAANLDDEGEPDGWGAVDPKDVPAEVREMTSAIRDAEAAWEAAAAEVDARYPDYTDAVAEIADRYSVEGEDLAESLLTGADSPLTAAGVLDLAGWIETEAASEWGNDTRWPKIAAELRSLT